MRILDRPSQQCAPLQPMMQAGWLTQSRMIGSANAVVLSGVVCVCVFCLPCCRWLVLPLYSSCGRPTGHHAM
jgi:hypothetical protein